VRAKVEHAFRVIKRIFGFAKVSYRGLKKNGNRLFMVAALGQSRSHSVTRGRNRACRLHLSLRVHILLKETLKKSPSW
jgi:hypothetical protein